MKNSKNIDPKNNLCGRLPKVGIRPTIDGRLGGVRESLEEQTMNMAKKVALLISENIKHSNGEPVECVIADTCIGGVAEAANAADKFSREGVGVSLTVTSCWCYGSETMDMNPYIPKAIWGFNGTERPGAVYLAAVLAAHNQKGLPAFSIYGKEVQDASDTSIPNDVKKKILQFIKAGLAVATIKDKSYLSLGSVSMGIAGSIVNEEFFQDYLGMRNEYVDMSEFTRRIEEGIYDKKEYDIALKWVKANCKEGTNNNRPEKVKSRVEFDKDWETVVKMTLITKDLMIGNSKLADIGFKEESLGHNAIASGFQGQRQWTDYKPNGDFMEAILNSSFDWNGIRESFIVATENDSLNGVTMLFGHLLSDTAQVFADIRTYWSAESVKRVTGKELKGVAKNGFIHLVNSGSAALDGCGEQRHKGKAIMKPFWDITDEDVSKCLNATTWSSANLDYFRGGGFSSNFMTNAEMPVTLSRINLVKGLGPVLQIAEGYTVDLPEEISSVINNRTDPTWPTTWFAPILNDSAAFKDVYSVMHNWGANHGVFSYGHIGDYLITLASMLRIPVCMHNVSEKRIFRPSTWSSFGMDSENSDFRACKNFGPLYGKG